MHTRHDEEFHPAAAEIGVSGPAFDQKAGCCLWRIERDFFTPARRYPKGIEENGIPLRDMVWMEQELVSLG